MHSSFRRFLLIGLCALPLLLVYGILWRETTALPLLDDYHAIFVFALDQRHLSSMGKLAAVVTAQHNEYKLIFEHAIIAADLALSGRIHLLLLVWLGNLMLVPIGIIFGAQFRPKEPIDRRLILFLPLCWLLFQLTYAEMVDWAMEGLNALAVVCFAVASFYLLTRESRRSFVLACVAGVLSALASANGFVIAPIGLVILLTQRRRTRVLPWCVGFGLALAAYLYGYTPMPHGTPASIGVRLLFVPSMLGGAIENMHGPVRHAAIALGLLLLAVYAHAVWRRFYKAQPFIMATATWAVITAMMTAWVRSSLGLNLSLSSRYKIYSALMIVFCYQYLADRVIASTAISESAKRTLYAGVLAAAVLFGLAADAWGDLKLLKTRRSEAIAGLGWYLTAPQTRSPFPDYPGVPADLRTEARRSLTEAIESGIYMLPHKAVTAACATKACTIAPGR